MNLQLQDAIETLKELTRTAEVDRNIKVVVYGEGAKSVAEAALSRINIATTQDLQAERRKLWRDVLVAVMPLPRDGAAEEIADAALASFDKRFSGPPKEK